MSDILCSNLKKDYGVPVYVKYVFNGTRFMTNVQFLLYSLVHNSAYTTSMSVNSILCEHKSFKNKYQ